MKRIIYSVMFYLMVISLVILTKPQLMFDSNGNILPFGIGEDKTMISFGVLTVVLAIVSFYIFCFIDLIFD